MTKHSIANKKVAVILLAILLLFSVIYFAFARLRTPATDNKQLLTLIMGGINAVHYAPKPVDDSFSEKIFKEFIKRVDYNKKVFIQSDIDELSKYKVLIDDEINDSSFDFFNAVMKIYAVRIEQAYRYSKAHLDIPFNFDREESIETNEDKLSFATDTVALEDEWRKYMKLQVLQQVYDDMERQQKAKEKSDTVKVRSFEQLESDARKKVKKSNEEFFDRVHELENNDWVASYLNCISNVEDPHTEYFAPVQKQNFDIQITGQLEGIGAQLQQRDGEIKIASIVVGSASWRQGQLKAGDVILKVAQGAQEPVSVEGMRLDKAIQLIRGKKGTEVRLTVRKPDGSLLEVPIIRDVVVLEATYAKSALINSNGKQIGYIRLPEFYTALGQVGGRNCSEDVKSELLKLKSQNVSGVILDLRDNGGGSLQEAVKLGGLFISSGPVVQVRSRDTKPNVLGDTDPAVVYSGPLMVMVNTNSASASEIVAAALQDYHRAVIIGSNSTFGKGTVQNIYNLDDFVSHSQNSAPAFGSVKITIQKYYRVNGGSTQIKGVAPDIIIPDPYSEIPHGEKEDPFAIEWDEITPAKYEPLNLNHLDDLKLHSEKRIASSGVFQLIREEAADFKERSENTKYSLNFAKFSAQQKEWDVKEKKYDAITADTTLLNVSNLTADLSKINSADSTAVARNNQFLKNLRRDIYLSEAAQVVGEMK